MPIVASRRPVGPCWRCISSPPFGERNPSPRRQPLGYEQHTRTHTLARRSRALSRCFGEKGTGRSVGSSQLRAPTLLPTPHPYRPTLLPPTSDSNRLLRVVRGGGHLSLQTEGTSQ
ncbi:hypothetical protein CEXT_144771 [Caerostris extrusa]|uniref:Uncharacterized protein n=1 Tax=Caerostris extrusa TaxID=172846 RepID=A0AAV4WZY2_CAEEX|nr:hypothetical protein CEXT_144771 [Caerostris extrusa]